MSDVKYIDSAEAAKMIRADLKGKFPGQKFSVTTSRYSGGSSIRVKWQNGPTVKQVKGICDHYEGASFDGMIDLQSYQDTIRDGEAVHYGCNYVFEDRDYTADFLQPVAERIAKEWGCDMPEIKLSTYDNTAYLHNNYVYPGGSSQSICEMIMKEVWDTTAFPEPEQAEEAEPAAKIIAPAQLELIQPDLALTTITELIFDEPISIPKRDHFDHIQPDSLRDALTDGALTDRYLANGIAAFARWDGCRILEVAALALEDANFGKEAFIMRNLLELSPSILNFIVAGIEAK